MTKDPRGVAEVTSRLWKKYKEIIIYLIVGGLTTVVSLGIYYALVLTVLDPDKAVQLQAANVIAWIGAVIFAYFANRIFVFESHTRGAAQRKEAAGFFTARIGTLLMDMATMLIGVTLLHGNDKIVKLLAQVIVTVANYLFSKLFVFRKKPEEKEPEREKPETAS